MNFYGELPDSFNLVVNSNHPLVTKIMAEKDDSLGNEISDINSKIKPLEEDKTALEALKKDKKEEEIPQEEKDKLEDTEKKISTFKKEKDDLLTKYGKDNKLVKQLIDLALLANGMLKGEELTKFVKRSVELIK